MCVRGICFSVAGHFRPTKVIIKDNSGFGEWDWDILANEWDAKQLIDWGVDLPVFDLPIDDEQPKENDDDKDVCELCGK